ncbi:MAG TPA: phosphoadenylyl-sulfate reductase [Rhodospirillaceae bacterium]|jgi:phosphoadenosine phosphosulfate reductase|nr:phosphoadenylyl-sulfate reductase [Alphaproteobacteria bacterium]HBH26303.1 phosphoadenylyl-sulfate reductase [Rhodospirillaceae bacterium]
MHLDAQIADLAARYGALDGADLLRAVIHEAFPGRIAVVSSFGAEAALGLAMVAEVDPATPVIFLNTRKHFPETLAYRDALIARLGLTDVRSVEPDPSAIAGADPDGLLWQRNPDACCYLRKVVPLEESLHGFAAWVTGRKRVHGGSRTALPTLEHDGRRVKINPFARWSQSQIDHAWQARDLPEHPMIPFGYTSVGCMPCTREPVPGGGRRSGRWAEFGKTECGIHGQTWDGGSGGGI